MNTFIRQKAQDTDRQVGIYRWVFLGRFVGQEDGVRQDLERIANRRYRRDHAPRDGYLSVSEEGKLLS